MYLLYTTFILAVQIFLSSVHTAQCPKYVTTLWKSQYSLNLNSYIYICVIKDYFNFNI